MLLILWIFLCTGQILQWFLSLLLNWQKIFSSKLETGLERQRNVQRNFVFGIQCSEAKIREGSPTERLYLTSFSWHSQKQRCLGMFPHCIFDFGGDQKTQFSSVTVLHSGYYKALRFRDNCFLESAYETNLWQNQKFSFLSGIWSSWWWSLITQFGALMKDNNSQKALLSHSSLGLWNYLSLCISQL